MQREVTARGSRQSAARVWAPLARFIDWEARLGEAAEARGPVAHFAYEFVRFGVKQAWACLFGALLLGLLIATHYFYRKGVALARYDFLVKVSDPSRLGRHGYAPVRVIGTSGNWKADATCCASLVHPP